MVAVVVVVMTEVVVVRVVEVVVVVVYANVPTQTSCSLSVLMRNSKLDT